MRDSEAFETERHWVLFSSGSSRKIGNVVLEGYTNQSEYIGSKISACLLIGGGELSLRGEFGEILHAQRFQILSRFEYPPACSPHVHGHGT